MERISIKAFRASEDPIRANRFLGEHQRVLQDAGVSSALPSDDSWTYEDECAVITAEHPTLGMVGGCKIKLVKSGRQLPFEKHLLPLETDLRAKANDALLEGGSELCGLWVAQRYAGHGLPWYLTAAATSIASQLSVRSIVCLAAEYSMDYAIRNGFVKMTEVGMAGQFIFPIPSIRSYALINREPISLQHARSVERQRLISLRLNPNQVRLEPIKGQLVEVAYSLKLDQKVIPISQVLNDEARVARRSA